MRMYRFILSGKVLAVISWEQLMENLEVHKKWPRHLMILIMWPSEIS